MPDPKTEISKLSKDSPEKIKSEEIKRTWLEEDLTRTPESYDKLNTSTNPDFTFSDWKTSVEDNISFADQYAVDVFSNSSSLKTIDENSQKAIKFEKQSAETTYTILVGQFYRDQFFSDKAQWPIPAAATSAWRTLVEQATKQVQRNGTDLSLVATTIKSLATEDINKSDPTLVKALFPNGWEKSSLFNRLTYLEGSLKEWDRLLGSYASLGGDKTLLYAKASDCATWFSRFAESHAEIYKTFKGADGEPPYLKYQLLATAKALAEKVASQFAARATTSPTFSAMYELSTNIPVAVSKNDAQSMSTKLTTDYTNNNNPMLQVAWEKQQQDLAKKLIKIDPTAHQKLDNFFKTLELKSIDIPEYNLTLDAEPFKITLKDWSNFYSNFDPQSPDLISWQKSTESIALKLRKCKEAVDEILPGFEVSGIRKQYQTLLDGFAWKIQSGILLCLAIS